MNVAYKRLNQLIGLFLLACALWASAAQAVNLTPGMIFSGNVTSDRSRGSNWALELKIVRVDAVRGNFEAEIKWPTLDSVHGVDGVINQDGSLSFTENRHIRRGRAHLNCRYQVWPDREGGLRGKWEEPGADQGDIALRLSNPQVVQAEERKAPSVGNDKMQVTYRDGRKQRFILRQDSANIVKIEFDSSASDSSQSDSIRIEACVDGVDLIRVDNHQLTVQHRMFAQVGTHPDCPSNYLMPGGGILVDGERFPVNAMPKAVDIASIGRFVVERGRGRVTMEGNSGLLIEDPSGGADLYVIRLYAR